MLFLFEEFTFYSSLTFVYFPSNILSLNKNLFYKELFIKIKFFSFIFVNFKSSYEKLSIKSIFS